jgi:hypothetical protein
MRRKKKNSSFFEIEESEFSNPKIGCPRRPHAFSWGRQDTTQIPLFYFYVSYLIYH